MVDVRIYNQNLKFKRMKMSFHEDGNEMKSFLKGQDSKSKLTCTCHVLMIIFNCVTASA